MKIMNITLKEGPWPAKNHVDDLHYWVTIDGTDYLCRITGPALFDDYQKSYESQPTEVFEEFLDDVLRRTVRMLPRKPEVQPGQPTVIIKKGDAFP
ncbi:hypothetical protein [Pelagimonas sp. KU-00592-HH]|uniref:hypothetical protein n=1 Tax=Pelagimonas sp. KU-00592-HH TaxID=3127651 RepID=UPI0033419E4C